MRLCGTRRHAGRLRRDRGRPAPRWAMISTAWSTRSTIWRCRTGWGSGPPRRAGRSRTSFPRNWPGPGSRPSTSRSAAPARCRPGGAAEPVTVGGVVVSNATLHNEDYIAGRDSTGAPIRDGKDIRVGDWVQVYRAGDVIPKVADVDLAKRPADATPFAFPATCPECGSDAVREEGDSGAPLHRRADLPGAGGEKLKHFVSRAPSTSRGWAPSRSRRSTPMAGSRAGRHLHARGALRRRPAAAEEPRGLGREIAANLFDAIDGKARIPLGAADLRAGHPPCG
jgi:hypothetical protein